MSQRLKDSETKIKYAFLKIRLDVCYSHKILEEELVILCHFILLTHLKFLLFVGL